MEMIFKNYKYKENLLNFTIEKAKINGITGKDTEELARIINLKNTYRGKIIIDHEELTKDNINEFKNKISIINEEIEENIKLQTVYDLLYYEIIRRKLKLKNPDKKIKDSLKIVELDQNILKRNIYTLSSSEKKLIQIAMGLLSNPSLIIMIEPFKFLDKINEKKIVMLLNKMKDIYKKTIIFVSNNSNILHKYTTHLIVFKNDKILAEGETEELYKRVDFLTRNKIAIPEIVEFTYIAKKKKDINIDYHKDIRDIIKDIYKHV